MAYILIADDDPDLSSAVSRVLTAAGYETEIQGDADDAIKSVEQRRPDLILLDVMFPGNVSGGFDVARKLSTKYPDKARIPILMISAVNKHFSFGFSSTDIDPEWLPIVEFIEKPVDFDVLKSKVSKLLSEAHS